MSRADLDKDPHAVAAMFDGVARRYDLTNTVLTAGQDRRWRALARRALDLRPGEIVLDLAAGTAVSTVELARSGAWCVAADFSLGMLRAGAGPRRAQGRRRRARAARSPTPCSTPSRSPSACATCTTPTARSPSWPASRSPAGGWSCASSAVRRWAPFRAAYYLGLERVLPAVADRVSSNPEAYRYLGESIRDWPAQPELAARIAAAGWARVGLAQPRGRGGRPPPRPKTVTVAQCGAVSRARTGCIDSRALRESVHKRTSQVRHAWVAPVVPGI